MFTFRDFAYLPAMYAAVEKIIQPAAGLVIVAGPEIRLQPASATSPGAVQFAAQAVQPSGRATIFQMLMDEALTRHPQLKCRIIAENKDSLRVARSFRRRVEYQPASPPYTYGGRLQSLPPASQALVVLDHLVPDNLQEALVAAEQGAWVLAQLETVGWGGRVVQHLLDLGVPQQSLAAITWILTVQRMPTLCTRCKQPAELYSSALEQLGGEGSYFRPGGCEACRYTGHQGDAAVFDVFQAGAHDGNFWDQPSLLPMEAYVREMVRAGSLQPADYLEFERSQYRRIYYLYQSSEKALRARKGAYEAKVAEIEATNRVLQQRTQSLVALYEISQALMGSTSLADLAKHLCRKTCELCRAERSVLYYLLPNQHGEPEEVEILAVGGWSEKWVRRRLPWSDLRAIIPGREVTAYNHWPPGIPVRHRDVEGVDLRSGLLAPLYAHKELVGVMIINTIRREGFTPGEVALLETCANQAALGIQRAGLVDQLQAKVTQLEAAQLGLAAKERMEHELALARQVQQRVLPHTFPSLPGYQFAARNEPARQVGGDFYDVIVIDEDHVGVAMADVSDKGMPAAVFMAMARSLLRAEAHGQISPRLVLERVNSLLFELGDADMFVTLFYGVIERSTGKMVYARAGHDRPVLIHAGETTFLSGEGMALGVIEGEERRLDEEQVWLKPGDRLVLYTDGLCDLELGPGKAFGVEGLAQVLAEFSHLAAEEMCAAVFRRLVQMQGQAVQYDDMTLMIVAVDD